MADLPAVTLTSATTEAAELYDKLVYGPQPTIPHLTFEAMNGSMDPGNWKSGAKLPAWGWQYGAFAQGKWHGFDQHEFVYARQMGGGGKQGQEISERAVLAQHTTNIFLPWTASVVLFGVQASFQQDATVWDNDLTSGGPFYEFWDYRIEFGGNVFPGMYGRLPHARASASMATDGVDPGYACEHRWRYVSKFGMVKNVPKGHTRVRMSMWAGVFAPDGPKAKVVIPTGGVWVLALR
jgi:hypothetical protein